jgi:hypothetical protein
MRGFSPPSSGTPMCRYLVAWCASGRLAEPRSCKRAAKSESPFCALHQRVAMRVPHVDVRDGGYCVWCGQSGRSYIADRVTITLCVIHGRALERALREGR